MGKLNDEWETLDWGQIIKALKEKKKKKIYIYIYIHTHTHIWDGEVTTARMFA